MHDDKGVWFPNYIKTLFHDRPKRVQALINIGHKAKCKCCDSKENLTFDHIVPTSKGGKNSNSNGQILCKRCNRVKANKIITIKKLRTLIQQVFKSE